MKPRSYFFGRLLLPAAAFISFTGSAHAADGTWDFGGSTNDWQTVANWNPDGLPGTTSAFASTETATFGTTGSGTINLGNLINIRDIRFGVGFGNANGFIIGDADDTLDLSNSTGSTNGRILMGNGVTTSEQIGVAGTLIKLSTSASSTYSFTNNSNTTLAQLLIGGAISTSAASGTSVLTLNGTNGGTVSGVISNGGTATMALTKAGAGFWALTGANTYTGNTTVSGGTLKLDFTASGAPSTNIISSSSVLKLGGGTLQIVGASGGSTQTFASTSFTAATGGQSVISAAPFSGTIPVVNLGVLSGTQGALVRFDGAAYNSGASSGTTIGGTLVNATANFTATTRTNTNGLIVVQDPTLSNGTNTSMAYATVGLYDWAAISGATTRSTASTGTIVGASQNAGFYTVINSGTMGNLFGTNYDITGSVAMPTAGASLSTARFNANAAVTLTTGNAAGAIVGGILVTPNVNANNITIAGSQGLQPNRSSTGGATGFTIWQNNSSGQLIFNAAVINGANIGATASYTQGGAGTVVMNASNGYTGQTYLDGGTTVISAFSGLGGGAAPATLAAVNLNGGTIFGNAASVSTDFSGSVLRAVNLNGVGGGLAASAGNTLTVGGVIAGTSISAPLTIGTGTIAGTGAGTANTTAVVGSGTVSLTGGNTYAGGTIVKAGTLQINGINALGGTNYGGLTLDGGTLKYATAFTGNGSGDLTSVGTAGITIASGGGTIDTNGNSVTYAGSIGNGGGGSLTKSGAGTLTLSAASSYTGGTIISGGTLTAGNASSLGAGALAIGSGGTLSSGGFNLGVGAITLSGSANILLSGTSSQITSSGAISISGASNVLTLGGSAATAGNTYTLVLGSSLSASGISLTGSGVGGSSVNLGSNSTVGRTTYAFNATATALELAVTGGAYNLTWNGGNANWNTTDANWQKDGVGANIAFFAGDNITISAGASIAVDGGGVTAGTLAANNASGTAILTGGTVAAASLSKSGAGTLQLDNTISGATLAMNDGVLALGSQSQSFANITLTGGSITGSSAVLTGTGSAFDVRAGSVSAILNGSLGLTKSTAGTVNLSGVNTYTGPTAVNAGTLAISGSGNLGNATALTFGGGTLALGGTSQTVGAVNITAAATSGNTIENGSLTGTSYAVSNASDNAIVAANLLANGAAGLNKTGAGILTLSGANTYTGATLVKNGSLVLDGGTDRLLNTGSVVIGDTATTGKLILGGATVAGQTLTGLTTSGLGGSAVGGNGSNSTLTLNIAGTNTFGGTLGGAGTNENNLALIKSGAGTLTLSGANTFTGGTQLNGGTLVINNGSALGSGTLTALNGTTISLTTNSGIGNAVSVSGTNASVTITSNQGSAGYGSNISGTADQTVVISGNPVNFNNTTRQFTNFFGTVNILSGSTLSDRSSATNWENGGDTTLFNVDGSMTSRNAGTWALGGLTGSGTLSMGTAGSNGIGLTYTIGARNDTSDTFSGVIQNGDTATSKLVSVTKTGTGTQIFSGASTFTGSLTVNQGTLAAALGNNTTNPVSSALGNTQVARNITVNNTGTLRFDAGDVMGGADSTIASTLVINSGGTVTNNGTSFNTLGALTLNGGTLTGTGGSSNGQFQMYAFGGTVTVVGSSASTISSATGTVNGGTAIDTVGYHLGTGVATGTTFNVANATGNSASDLNVSAILIDRTGGLGVASLTKSGVGTMTLSGANTYTGSTSVSAGKLVVNGSITSDATIASGATIGGSGTITGNLALSAESTTGAGNGGKLAAGNSPGVLTVTSTTTFNTGSIFSWDLDTTQTDPETNRSVAYDGVNSGAVAGSNAIFQVVLAGAQDFSSTFWEQDRTWSDIFKTADGSSALSSWASAFSSISYSNGLTTLDTPAVYGSFTLSGSNLHWDSSFSAVPEPTSALAGLLIGAGLLRRRRSA